ncbi:MAG: FAD-binding protein, partial [Armatimonadota bacterium]|nr:FAD-binding protein [Armatimonadota bacterium]
MIPIAALSPPDASATAAALALLAEEGSVCVPWGGGCRQEMGYLPGRYDLALSTANLTRLVDLQPGDLTVTVEAGMTLAQLQSLLAEHGQFVALESPQPERET